MAEEKTKCWHYSNVDEGFFCWKCVEHKESEAREELLEEIENYFEATTESNYLIQCRLFVERLRRGK